jgi:hypothetical protein
MRGAFLNARFAVNGIQNDSRLFGRAVMDKTFVIRIDGASPASRSLQ